MNEPTIYLFHHAFECKKWIFDLAAWLIVHLGGDCDGHNPDELFGEWYYYWPSFERPIVVAELLEYYGSDETPCNGCYGNCDECRLYVP